MDHGQKTYEFWIDSIAKKVVEREQRLNRGIDVIRTESGIGASGIPHIGSMSDAARSFGISLAIEDLGGKNEYIAFSDSLDGLRKVPSGMPDWLEKHIGQAVSDIPDPFGDCHKSYGDHMSGLLIDGLEKCGIKFKFISGAEFYRKGGLNDQIGKILQNHAKVGQIIQKITGQEKYLAQLPYFAVCENCGKIYTTQTQRVEGRKVHYRCDQEFKGENKGNGKKIVVKGCGHEGSVDYTKGQGKLAWKVDFAARWAALKISFEAYGKDIEESVKVNDAVCREVLGFEPPVHVMYELFLEKGGRKISKSFGNVFTPQVWLEYGTPQSLMLLMYKRFQGARELDVTDIPKYMDEVNHLAKIYFKMEEVGDREMSNMTRLFEYINFLRPPKSGGVMIPYSVVTELAKILPEKDYEDFAIERLTEFGYLGNSSSDSERRSAMRMVEFGRKWINDFEKPQMLDVAVKGEENRAAIRELIDAINEINEADALQNEIFEIAKRNNIKTVAMFRAVYRILLGADRGPRLGAYILERGKAEVIEKLKSAI